MHPYPHRYRVRACGAASGSVAVRTADAPELETNPPPEFDGPRGYWSPETLLAAAVADCYVLSFRAVARASKLAWRELDVDVEAVLDRIDGSARFTAFRVVPRLVLESEQQQSLALTVLEKSKRACLVTNSLNADVELAPEIVVLPEVVAG